MKHSEIKPTDSDDTKLARVEAAATLLKHLEEENQKSQGDAETQAKFEKAKKHHADQLEKVKGISKPEDKEPHAFFSGKELDRQIGSKMKKL